MDKKITVESSKSVLAPSSGSNMNVIGLEDIPSSLIPVPFYKLVQPGSTKTSMSDGKDAPVGTILMGDSGQAVESLRFLLLRAKRQHREFKGDDGQMQRSTSIGVLGINLDRLTPFMLSISVASFSNFGQLMAQIKENKLVHAWDQAISVTTEKVETEKDTSKGRQTVKFWIMKFGLENKELTETESSLAEMAFNQYGSSLDRNQEDIVVAPVTSEVPGEPTNTNIPF